MKKRDLLFLTMLSSSIITSSVYAMESEGEDEKRNSQPITQNHITSKAHPRTIDKAGWNKLSQDEKARLIPSHKAEIAEAVSDLRFGYQFKHLGEIERYFTKACETLNKEETVVIWGDGYGRISIDAFRRNNQLRVIYNDIDSENSTALKNFKEVCLKESEQDNLCIELGDCLKVPYSDDFRKLFPNQNPWGQLQYTVGFNFMHFMPPEDVVKYFGLQFDLLKPGGKTYIISQTPFVPEDEIDFAKNLTEKEFIKIISNKATNQDNVNKFRNSIQYPLNQYFKNSGLLFYPYFNPNFFNQSKKLLPAHKKLLSEMIFSNRITNRLSNEAIKTIATTLGLKVTYVKTFDIFNEGIENLSKNLEKGSFGAYILEKPENISSHQLSQETSAYKTLIQQAQQETKEIQEVFESKISFSREYPYIVIEK